MRREGENAEKLGNTSAEGKGQDRRVLRRADECGDGENRLMCHIGNYYHVFEKLFEQVKTGEPIEYLDEEMRKIFKRSGYPDEFFSNLFHDWDIDTNKKEKK